MRIGIFYISFTDSLDRESLALPSGGHVYIRVEEVDAQSDADALVMAKPREGEHVMNTHTLEQS